MAKKTPVKKAVKKATKKVAGKTVKKAGKKATKKVAGKTVKKAVRKTAKKAVKKTAVKKTARKAVVKKTVKKTAKKAKTSSFLTKKEVREFEYLLLEKRRSLLGDMAGIENNALGRNLQDSAGDLSNMPTHPADIGSDNFEHEFTLGLLESERALLCEINEALERLMDNTFGICAGTGKPIGKPRLRARPWCKYSIEYQRLVEKGLIRPGEPLDDEED